MDGTIIATGDNSWSWGRSSGFGKWLRGGPPGPECAQSLHRLFPFCFLSSVHSDSSLLAHRALVYRHQGHRTTLRPTNLSARFDRVTPLSGVVLGGAEPAKVMCRSDKHCSYRSTVLQSRTAYTGFGGPAGAVDTLRPDIVRMQYIAVLSLLSVVSTFRIVCGSPRSGCQYCSHRVSGIMPPTRCNAVYRPTVLELHFPSVTSWIGGSTTQYLSYGFHKSHVAISLFLVLELVRRVPSHPMNRVLASLADVFPATHPPSVPSSNTYRSRQARLLLVISVA